MPPSIADRDLLFKTFGKAWFRRDADLLYQAVTPDFVWSSVDGAGEVRRITGRSDVAAALIGSLQTGVKRTFEDVVYHHAPDASFMTFRLIETNEATGQRRVSRGIERYTFHDGRIAHKDVYRKLAE